MEKQVVEIRTVEVFAKESVLSLVAIKDFDISKINQLEGKLKKLKAAD